MNKLIKEGKVAVLVSSGFGAGWSTWNGDCIDIVFHKEIAEYIDKNGSITEEVAKDILNDDSIYTGGVSQLEIQWLDVGTAFRVTEYDGNEDLEVIDQLEHYIA